MNNPFLFFIDNDKLILSGDRIHISDRQSNQSYIKMTTRVIKRSHAGYCSEYDYSFDEEAEHEDILLVHTYFEIKSEEEQSLIEELWDEESGEIQANERNESWFADWSGCSECFGSGYCNYIDSYIPVKYEFVQIVD